jgi:putative glutamine amidotransferase
MSAATSPPRIAVLAPPEPERAGRASGPWATGFDAGVTAAGGVPVRLRRPALRPWEEILDGIEGVIFAGGPSTAPGHNGDGDGLCASCRELGLPLLAVDRGLHALNTAFGGTLYNDLRRELPQALQHLGAPEPDDRHAVSLVEGTRLAALYGSGEAIVNSLHRRAVARAARGFVVSALSLDGVVEAIEAEGERWFAVGVQWHPASASASGLDIQLFRGLVEACGARRCEWEDAPCLAAA